jgi:hypothetical protein
MYHSDLGQRPQLKLLFDLSDLLALIALESLDYFLLEE